MDRGLRAAPPAGAAGLSRRVWIGLTLAGLVPRFALALVFLRFPIGLDDMYQYDMLARSLASGNGYRWYAAADVLPIRPYLERVYGWDFENQDLPEKGFLTSHRAPGYPAFLAGIYALSGPEDRIAAARLAQAVLGAALAPLTAWLALRLGLAPRAARWSGLALALYPVLWMYPLGLGSENLFLPLVLLSLIALLTSAERRQASSAIAPAIALAAGVLTRSVLAAFLPFAAYWLYRRRGWRHAAVLLGVSALAVLPWSIRNTLVNGRLTFIENSGGYNMFIGYHPQGDGGFVAGIASIPLRFVEDAERDRWSWERALQFIRDDPSMVPIRVFHRLVFLAGLEDREMVYFYANGYFGPIPQPWLALAYLILVLPWVAVAGTAPLGLAVAWGNSDTRHGASLVLGLVAATLIAYLPILAEPRFHLPLVAPLACFAASVWARHRPPLALPNTPARRAAWVALAVLLVLWSADIARDAPVLIRVMSPGGDQLALSY
ncbi:MAG: glycosyltransferase family 39 protein [Anaerolineales bacterium]